MKNTTVILFSLFALITIKTRGQKINNLVPNGDFENVDSCFFWMGSIWKLKDWNAALQNSYSSSDYLNTCQYDNGFQINPLATESKISGSGCAAIQLKTKSSEAREYIQVKLNNLLCQDTVYVLSCNLIPVYYFSQTGLFIDRFELLISQNQILAPIVQGFIPGRIDTTPSLVYQGAFLNDTANWTTLKFTYKAKGGEQYLVIGNFSPDSVIGTQRVNDSYQGTYKSAYYLIDDVKLYKASDTIARNQPEPILPNVFSPNQDGVNEVYAIENLPENSTLEVFNRWGAVVFKEAPYQNNWPGNAPNGNPVADGVYFAILTYQDAQGNVQQKKQTVHVVR